MAQPLNFDAVRGSESDTWQRADPRPAVIARAGWDEWVVYFPDGENAHVVQLHIEGDTYVGACDCEGFSWNGICAHLCTLRKAAVVGYPDASGRPVEVDSTADRFAGDVDAAMRADGGERR